MDHQRRVLVVIPALNEEAAVGGVVKEVRQAVPDADVLVVDDGSTDATRELAQAAGAAVLSLPFNLGVGAAMRAGFRYARRQGYEAVVQVDGDGQHDPDDIPRLLEGLGRADVVVGARFAGKGDYRVSGARRWAMRFVASSLSRVTGTTLCDGTSGFRASGPAAVELFAAYYPAEYLGDTVESLVIAARSGCRVEQVPVAMRPRRAGTSSQSRWKAAAYLFRACLVVVLAFVRRRPDVRHLGGQPDDHPELDPDRRPDLDPDPRKEPE